MGRLGDTIVYNGKGKFRYTKQSTLPFLADFKASAARFVIQTKIPEALKRSLKTLKQADCTL